MCGPALHGLPAALGWVLSNLLTRPCPRTIATLHPSWDLAQDAFSPWGESQTRALGASEGLTHPPSIPVLKQIQHEIANKNHHDSLGERSQRKGKSLFFSYWTRDPTKLCGKPCRWLLPRNPSRSAFESSWTGRGLLTLKASEGTRISLRSEGSNTSWTRSYKLPTIIGKSPFQDKVPHRKETAKSPNWIG